MRAIVWAFISILVAVAAVHGLDLSSRRSARQEVLATFEIQPSLVDEDSEHHSGMQPPRYVR